MPNFYVFLPKYKERYSVPVVRDFICTPGPPCLRDGGRLPRSLGVVGDLSGGSLVDIRDSRRARRSWPGPTGPSTDGSV